MNPAWRRLEPPAIAATILAAGALQTLAFVHTAAWPLPLLTLAWLVWQVQRPAPLRWLRLARQMPPLLPPLPPPKLRSQQLKQRLQWPVLRPQELRLRELRPQELQVLAPLRLAP